VFNIQYKLVVVQTIPYMDAVSHVGLASPSKCPRFGGCTELIYYNIKGHLCTHFIVSKVVIQWLCTFTSLLNFIY